MRKQRKWIGLSLVLGVLIVAIPGTASALLLDFSPATQTINPGGHADIEVWLKELNGTVIGAYDISFSFDPAVLSLAASPVAFEAGLGAPGNSVHTFAIGPAGALDVAEVSLLDESGLIALQSAANELHLFTLSFVGREGGSSGINPYFLKIVQSDGGEASYTVTFSPAVVVEPGQPVIPEPGTLLLFGVGLFGLACLRKRSTSRRE